MLSTITGTYKTKNTDKRSSAQAKIANTLINFDKQTNKLDRQSRPTFDNANLSLEFTNSQELENLVIFIEQVLNGEKDSHFAQDPTEQKLKAYNRAVSVINYEFLANTVKTFLIQANQLIKAVKNGYLNDNNEIKGNFSINYQTVEIKSTHVGYKPIYKIKGSFSFEIVNFESLMEIAAENENDVAFLEKDAYTCALYAYAA